MFLGSSLNYELTGRKLSNNQIKNHKTKLNKFIYNIPIKVPAMITKTLIPLLVIQQRYHPLSTIVPFAFIVYCKLTLVGDPKKALKSAQINYHKCYKHVLFSTCK